MTKNTTHFKSTDLKHTQKPLAMFRKNGSASFSDELSGHVFETPVFQTKREKSLTQKIVFPKSFFVFLDPFVSQLTASIQNF
jgi:hypothetical protein